MNPRYQIYVISKGRWESRLTSKTLEYMNVPYKIVIEPKEYKQYSNVIDNKKIIILPDNFSELGKGSIPVRNFIWEYSINKNQKKHWIVDDNINLFFRLNYNLKVPVSDGTIFTCMEDFTDRYTNIAFSGPDYFMFASRKCGNIKPYRTNTRVYSCTLINNSIPFRWRGKYNEDTDICLRALKAGWCTILFSAFLQGKTTTMQMEGGNTDTIYNKGDNRLEFAESLQRQHPNLVKVTKKFGRWHHQVDYSQFKRNKLIKKNGLIIPNRVNNYGMFLTNLAMNKMYQKVFEFKED